MKPQMIKKLNAYFVFTNVFSFKNFNLDSMQPLSHVYMLLKNFLGHVIHLWMVN